MVTKMILAIDFDYYGYIYKITNNLSGKIYVGKKKGKPRLTEDYYGSGKLIKLAIKKYGISNFSKEILDYCSDIETQNTKEKYWIALLNSTDSRVGYNISLGGDFGDVFTNHPDKELIREKIRNSITGVPHPEWRRKLKSEYQTGRKTGSRSEESKKKMSEAQKNLYAPGYKHPRLGVKETPERLQQKRESKFVPVLQYTKEGVLLREWGSPCLVKEELGIFSSNVVACCKGKLNSTGGFVWKYKEDVNGAMH